MRAWITDGDRPDETGRRGGHVEHVDSRPGTVVQPHLTFVRGERDPVAGRSSISGQRDRRNDVAGGDVGDLEAVEADHVVDHECSATVDRERSEDTTAA